MSNRINLIILEKIPEPKFAGELNVEQFKSLFEGPGVFIVINDQKHLIVESNNSIQPPTLIDNTSIIKLEIDIYSDINFCDVENMLIKWIHGMSHPMTGFMTVNGRNIPFDRKNYSVTFTCIELEFDRHTHNCGVIVDANVFHDVSPINLPESMSVRGRNYHRVKMSCINKQPIDLIEARRIASQYIEKCKLKEN